MMCDSAYEVPRNRPVQRQNSGGYQGLWVLRGECSCLINTEFLSGMMKMSGNGGDGLCTTLQICLMLLNCVLTGGSRMWWLE